MNDSNNNCIYGSLSVNGSSNLAQNYTQWTQHLRRSLSMVRNCSMDQTDRIHNDLNGNQVFDTSNTSRVSTNGFNSNNGSNLNDNHSIIGSERDSPEKESNGKGRAIKKTASDGSSILQTNNYWDPFGQHNQTFIQKSKNEKSGKHVHFADDNSINGFQNTISGGISFDIALDSSIVRENYVKDDNNDCVDEKDSTGTFWDNSSAAKSSIMDEFCNKILKPMTNNMTGQLWGQFGVNPSNNNQYMTQQLIQNVGQNIGTAINNSLILGDNIWGNPSNPNNSIYRLIQSADENKSKIQKLLSAARKLIPKGCAPNYTWSGQLPRRIRTKTPIYSVKVFLGGIPYDLTDSDLHCTFATFGHIQIQWPGINVRSAIDGAAANKAGYVYIIFENYDNVAALLNSCTVSYRDLDSGCRWYYTISSRRQKSKDVQVIPFDIGDRFYMKNSFSGQMDHTRTVFVGALHGMLAADGLAKVMDDLFGGVVYAGLDTDKHKYPLGSGRVSFDNQDSYQKAISAAFVEIKSTRFKKKIQIDPYVDSESMCVVCRLATQNPIYCREEGIYFCMNCWENHHSEPDSANHRPIVKNKTSKA